MVDLYLELSGEIVNETPGHARCDGMHFSERVFGDDVLVIVSVPLVHIHEMAPKDRDDSFPGKRARVSADGHLGCPCPHPQHRLPDERDAGERQPAGCGGLCLKVME